MKMHEHYGSDLLPDDSGVSPVMRSAVEWRQKFGDSNFKSLVEARGLIRVPVSQLDGRAGLFDFGEGVQEYRLLVDSAGTFAYPDDGGRKIEVAGDAEMYAADINSLISTIRQANALDSVPSPAGMPASISLAARSVGEEKVLFVFDLTGCLEKNFAIGSWLEKISMGTKAVVILNPTASLPQLGQFIGGLKLFPGFFPTASDGWKIPRWLFCRPETGFSSEDALSIYSDKKIVLDVGTEKVFLLQKQISIRGGVAGFRYLSGLARMGTSRVAHAAFADEFLEFKTDGYEERVRQARTQGRKAVEKSFADPNDALDLLGPDPAPTGFVVRNFSPSDVLLWSAGHKTV